MSGLAAVLAGRHTPGIHRWESALDVAAVRHAVEQAGWTFGHVDGAALESRSEVLRAIGAALDFPPHHGANLDALHDCLRDLPGPTVLLWEAWSGFARALPADFDRVSRVLAERGPVDPVIEVLLRGAGPDEVAPLLE